MFLALAAGSGSTKASAVGLAVSPPRVSFDDMLRGGHAEQSMVVYNADPANEANYSVTVNNTISDAITITPLNGTIPPKSSVHLTIAADIPKTKANGQYNGTVTIDELAQGGVRTGGGGGGGVGAVPTVSLLAVVSYSVTDKQKLSLRVNSLAILDTEEGMGLPVALNGTNTGNVDANPTLTISLTNMNNTSVLSSQVKNITIHASKTENVSVTLPHTLAKGQYKARTDVVLGDKTIYNTTGLVIIYEKGMLRTKGELNEVSANNDARFTAGDVVKIIGVFINTGQLTVNAKLVCEVRADSAEGKIVGTTQSDELTVTPGQTMNLTTYYTAKDPGTYVVSGHVVYGKLITQTMATRINVSPSGWNVLPIALGVVAALVIGAAAYWYVRRKRV